MWDRIPTKTGYLGEDMRGGSFGQTCPMTNSLSPAQWQRLRELRDGSELTPAQAAELERLLEQADAHETELQAPDMEKLKMQTQALKEQNQALSALLQEKQREIARLTAQSLRGKAETRTAS